MFLRAKPKFRNNERVFNKYAKCNENGFLQPMSELSVSCIISDKRIAKLRTRYRYLCTIEDQVFDMPEHSLMSADDIQMQSMRSHSIADTCLFLAKCVGFLLAFIIVTYLVCLTSISIG